MNKRRAIVRVDSGIGNCGIGSVIIPLDVDRDEYIKTCYKTSTITAHLGFGYGSMNSIPVDSEVLQRLTFPEDESSNGSTIIWVKDEVTGIPIVIGVLSSSDDYQTLEQGMRRTTSDVGLSSVEQVCNANTPEYRLIVRGGNAEDEPVIQISAVSASRKAEVGISSDFSASMHADTVLRLSSNERLEFVVYEDEKEKLVCKYNRGEGFSYKDEFDNEITCKDGQIDIKSEKIVHNEGDQAMVRGDDLVDLLKELIQAIKAITVPTSNGPSGTPLNTAKFSSIAAKATKILSKKSMLK